MPTELIVLIISLLGAVILSIIFYQASISFPPPEKKRRREKAKAHYKNFVAQHRREAWRNYQSYLQQQQHLARQQYVRRIAGQARQVFFEAFPEFQNASNRGAFIRALVLELVGRIYQGHSGLSPQWQEKLEEVLHDAQGNYACRREAAAWFYGQKRNLEERLAAGEISQEHYEDELEQLQQIYDELLQELNI